MAYRHGSAVSYATSAGAVSLQLDAVLDGGKDSGDAVDKLEFGMSFDLGDIGKVGLAYVDTKDYMMSDPTLSHELVSGKVVSAGGGNTTTTTGGFDASIDFTHSSGWARARLPGGLCYAPEGTPHASLTGLQTKSACETDNANNQWVQQANATVPDTSMAWKLTDTYKNALGITGVDMNQLMLTTGTGDAKKTVMSRKILVVADDPTNTEPDTDTDSKLKSDAACTVAATAGTCSEARVYYTVGDDGESETYVMGSAVTASLPVTLGGSTTAPATDLMLENTDIKSKSTPGMKSVSGSRDTHIAAQFNLGPVSAYLGHSTIDSKAEMAKKLKVTHYGVSGGIGDTGMSFLIMARNKSHGTTSGGVYEGTSPWLVGLSKSLGDGATAYFEHGNKDNDESGSTNIGLQVNF